MVKEFEKHNIGVTADKHGMSGFAWSPITKMWSVEPEVWEQLIKAKPEAKKWMTTPIYNYDKLLVLFAKDRATSEGVETAKEKRQRWTACTAENQLNSTDEIANLVYHDEVILENVVSLDDDGNQMKSPEVPSRT